MPSKHQPTTSPTHWAAFTCECADYPWCDCLVAIAAPIVKKISRAIWHSMPILRHQYEPEDFDQEIWTHLMRQLPRWDESRNISFEKWIAYSTRYAAREIRRNSARHYRIYIESIVWREMLSFLESIYKEKGIASAHYYTWVSTSTPEQFMLMHDLCYKILEYARQYRQEAVPYVEDMICGYTFEEIGARHQRGGEAVKWWVRQCREGIKQELVESG